MTAGGGGTLRDVPGDDLAHDIDAPKGLRDLWRRWHLVPLVLLVLAVIAAGLVGVVVRADLRAASTGPTSTVTSEQQGLPDACGAPQEPIAAEQPWNGDAREASEQVFRSGIASAPDSPYVEGRDGWVFWGDLQAKNLSQALGRRVLSQEEMNAWYASMSSLRDRLEAEDIDFVIQIAPAKWSVYPEYLPEWTDAIRGATTFDYLRTLYPDLPILDMREGLRAAKDEGSPYVPLNSHWTKFGGTIGWNLLAECLTHVDAERYAGLAPLGIASLEPAVEANEYKPFGFEPDGERDTLPVWTDEPSPMTLAYDDGTSEDLTTDSSTDMLRLPAHTVTANPQSPATALILRDSQGANIDPGWQAGFAETWQYRHGLDDPEHPVNILDLAIEHRPDIVVLELTERHLNYVPPLVY